MKPFTALAAIALVSGAVLAAPAAKRAQVHRPAETNTALTRALANPARADQSADDERRKAKEVLAFSGVGPGDVVADLLPGGGYWTRIFATAVGPKGHVYGWWPQGVSGERSEKAIRALQARGLANVTAGPGTAKLPQFVRPLDIAWTVQNYHDVANNGGGEAALQAFDRAIFAALKPGGTYIVIDHADAPGTGLTNSETRHRIDPAVVERSATAAGFRLDGTLDVLRNPADDYSKGVFDPAIRGHTDQFVLRFRKPR